MKRGEIREQYLLIVTRNEIMRSKALLRRAAGRGTVGDNLKGFFPSFKYPAWFDNRTMTPVQVLGDAPILRTWITFEIREVPRVCGRHE